ncbi:biotin--[acetyl-CoA-carboxylase] ligase [Candidatus Tisiphia endosymbiont of Ditula angustiorana]|uniref:biotin--[acetyl-CoA-carboxylase] ligase n=1 Tax=Candidatus Tisiphia endosymbiont of Ditula angustiorana TaxID=3066272 RepID=UPI00312C935A
MSWQEKYNLLIFDEIDSTSSEAIRMAKACPDKNYVIFAKNQTKSRGRNTKAWHSSLGNLYVSILLNHKIDLNFIPQLSFVMAIVVYKTIRSLWVESENFIKLKWPNDVLINDRKVSGILLESISINDNNYLIIGVGINVKGSPLNIDQLATNLSDENIAVKDLEYLLELLMINFEKYFSRWKQEGFSKIRQYWLKRAYKLGKMVTVNDGNTKISGIFKDIDEKGSIRIELASGQVCCVNYATEIIY